MEFTSATQVLVPGSQQSLPAEQALPVGQQAMPCAPQVRHTPPAQPSPSAVQDLPAQQI
jgi:hypothetical protein